MSSTYSLYSGDSKTLTIPLTLDGSAFNPSGFLLIFTAKKSVADDDSKAAIQKVTGTGLTVSGTTATIALVPQDTASLARENLFCDIQAQNLTTGAVATVAFFRLRIDRDVTRSTTTSIPVVTAAPGVPIGPTGATGPMGPSATVSVGTVTTGAAGTSAAITNSGNSSAAVFNFTLPRGTTGTTGATGSAGPSNTLSVASVATGAVGSAATVSVGGTSPNQTLTFSIPRGDQGIKGDTGATGSAATLSVGSVSTGAAGSSVAITNSGSASAATLNFTIPRGDVGATGPTGPANTLSVAGVTTGAAGSAAAVTIGGTSPAQTLTFAIPKGDKGDAATVAVGTVSTGAAGSSATVSNTGTSAAAVLAFSIPRGDVGATGTAATVSVGTVSTGAAGSSASVANTGTTSAAVLAFAIPKGDTGATGPANTLTVSGTTTGAAGSSASVSISGTSPTQSLEFTIPKGDTGATGNAATVALGNVTTGVAGSSVSITNSGTTGAAVFDFVIPRGDIGVTGNTGAAATISLGTVTTGAAGSSASVTNSGNSSAATFNFTIPRGDTGPTGATGATTIPATTAKTTLIDADAVVILDSAAANGVKNVLFSNLWTWIQSKLGGNLTIGGTKSWSGQTELTGQTASSTTSAMTRGMLPLEQLFSAPQVRSWPIWTFANAGTGTVAQVTANGWRMTSGTAASAYGAGYHTAIITSGSNLQAIYPVMISHFGSMYLLDTSSGNRQAIRFVVGSASTTPTFADQNPISGKGYGWEIYYNATTALVEIRAFAHDGTTFTWGAGVTYDGAYYQNAAHIVVENTGTGTINLYVSGHINNGTYVRTSSTRTAFVTGGPTSGNLAGSNHYTAAVGHSTLTCSASAQCTVTNVSIKIN